MKISNLLRILFLFIFISNTCFGLELWEQRNEGLVSGGYNMTIFDVKDTFWLTTTFNLFKSTNFGAKWERQTLGYITAAEDLVNKDSIIILSQSGGDYGWAVVKSTNNGQTWYNASKGLGDSVHLLYSTLEMKDDYLFLGSMGAINRCPNLGEGVWEKKSNYVNLESWKKPMPNVIYSVDKYLFIADNNNGVWVSTDLGENWHEKNKGISFYGVFNIQSFDKVLYASTFGGGICRSYDWGENWERITPADSINIQRINSVYVNGNVILAATVDAGIYISRDNGKTWELEILSFYSGFNQGRVDSFLEKNGYLYACLEKFGVCRIKLSSLLTSAKDAVWEPITKTFPNPATDKITIELDGVFQNIQLYNLPGESVQIDCKNSLTNDKTIFELNTSQIPRGTYFYTITNGIKEVKGKFNKY